VARAPARPNNPPRPNNQQPPSQPRPNTPPITQEFPQILVAEVLNG
jgi:hypothetical protein